MSIKDKKKVYDHFKKFEGVVPYMYLDTNGRVTVGIGHLIDDGSEKCPKWVKDIPFVKKSDSSPASDSQIERDWKKIKQSDSGKRPLFYQKLTTTKLKGQDLKKLFEDDIKKFYKDLEDLFPSYSKFPEPVKLALLDLIFTLGKAGLEKFKKLKAAVDKEDWETASKESDRKGARDSRNRTIEVLFLEGKKYKEKELERKKREREERERRKEQERRDEEERREKRESQRDREDRERRDEEERREERERRKEQERRDEEERREDRERREEEQEPHDEEPREDEREREKRKREEQEIDEDIESEIEEFERSDVDVGISKGLND